MHKLIRQPDGILMEGGSFKALEEICGKAMHTKQDFSKEAMDFMIEGISESAYYAQQSMRWSGRYNSLDKEQRLKMLGIIINNDIEKLYALVKTDYTKRIKLYEMKYLVENLSSVQLRKVIECIFLKGEYVHKIKKFSESIKSDKLNKIIVMQLLM